MTNKSKFPQQYCILTLSVLLFFFTPVSDSTASKYGGQLVLSTSSDPKSFNDIIAKETSTTVVTSHIFEGLTRENAYTLKVEPNLAKSWDVSEDGLVWTFYLREDIRFNDGTPLTADDVVFTFNDLIYNPDIPSSSRDIFTLEEKPIGVKKIDTYTVQFTLPVKFAPFLRGMSQAILPKHKLKEAVENKEFNHTWGIDTDPKEIVGSGPYKLIRYDPGQRLVFEKNPYYWKTSSEGDNLPYINKIIYLIVQNQDVQLLKFLEGTTDAYSMRGIDFPYLKPIEKEKYFTIFDLGPDTGSQFIVLNQNRGSNPKTKKPYVEPHKLEWFTDVRFRKAIAHVIDRKQIIQIVKNGLGYPQYSPIGPGAGFFHSPNVKKHDYDLKEAKKLLTQAGFVDRNGDGILEDTKGNDIEFNLYTNSGSTERIEIATIVRGDLEKLGLNVNFQAQEFNTLVSKLNSTFEWDAIVIGLTGGTEPHFGKNVWNSGGVLHMWYPQQESPATKWEERVDELFRIGVQELDENKRKVIYDEFQMIISQQQPMIYTVLGAKLTAVRNKFENLDPTNHGGVFHNLEEIYIKDQYR